MRLWHKDLIHVLPRKQLVSQWRECCLIARAIHEDGTPNHILVNPVIDYPIEHFVAYTNMIVDEMESREYNCDYERFSKWISDLNLDDALAYEDLFRNWHNDRYFWQCYYNLQEKYDRGGISGEEWDRIYRAVSYRV